MGKTGILIRLIALITIPTVLMCLSCSRRSSADKHYRELPQEEIRPLLKGITGRELPDKADDLRAILYSFSGLQELFVAFQTDQEGCLYILDAFGGEHVRTWEFPHLEYIPDMSGFEAGCEFQKKLGVVLFHKDLLDRIHTDFLEYAGTGRYPENAVTGYYLELDDRSRLVFYRVLLFKDRGLVYIFAEQVPKGVYFR